MEYDALLFGNGLTLCFLEQIAPVLKEFGCSHDVYIDSFIESFIKSELSPRESNDLHKIFKDGFKYSYDFVKDCIVSFFEEYKADFERPWGELLTNPRLFSKCDQYKVVLDCLPVFYNYWYCNLIGLMNHFDCSSYIDRYTASVEEYLSPRARVFTTNFDMFFDGLKPEHIHGRFKEGFKVYSDLAFHWKSSNDFVFPFIWAPSEVGKMRMIKEISKLPNHNKFYDFSFFYADVYADNLLIYGIGFPLAGYMKGLDLFSKKYETFSFGSCIDDHILVRLKRLLCETKTIKKITFAYYNEAEENHYKKIINDYGLPNAVLRESSDFCFHI